MDLYFNELSVSGLTEDTIYERVVLFANVVREARQQGFRNVRFEKDMRGIMLGHNLSFAKFCENNSKDPIIKALFSIQGYPYFTDEEGEASFVLNDYCVIMPDGHKESVYGLAAAVYYNSCGVSFNTTQWEGLIHKVVIVSGDITRTSLVLSLSEMAHFYTKEFSDWADAFLPEPELIRSKSIPLDKKISLQDHHGKDILFEFSKRLVRSPFVEEIISSIERKPNEKDFIFSLHDGNLIDIRLIKHGGIGVRVRTTAKNERQLSAIAKRLEEQFGQ